MYTINQVKNGVIVLLTITLSIWILFSFTGNDKEVYYPERARIILREVGNKLLLANNDSISLVMPVKSIAENEFEIFFQKELAIDPDFLIETTNSVIYGTGIATDYIIEVINCKTNDVAYSYQVSSINENTVIPCSGRKLPISCYSVRCLFLPKEQSNISKNMYPITTLAMLMIVVSGSFFLSKKRPKTIEKSSTGSAKLGKYIFYIDQQVLDYDNKSIRLTSKEVELLKIFYHHPNQVIKRERLVKEVWEDHGVFVGRSLDMFISKLRKKLSQDPAIKIINIHGVGYKMEI